MTVDPVPRTRTFVLIGLITVATMLATAAPASAAPSITVSRSTGLNAAGDRITVTGSGFDRTKGIYVAVCVDNGPGQLPTPCLGGADTGAAAGGSAWISDHPPSYGKGLTTPYGDGGTFSVTLSVIARDPVTGTDCTKVRCAVVTRADHTRTADRSQDARVPITFGAPPAPPRPESTTPPPPPVTTTTVPPTTTAPPTTTTTEPTTTTTPTTTAAPAVDRTAAETGGAGAGLWIASTAAVLLAAGTVVLLIRRRPSSPNDA